VSARKLIFFLLVASILVCVAVYVAGFASRLQFNRALYELNQGNYSAAEQRLRPLQGKKAIEGDVQLRLAEVLIRKGDYASGREILRASKISGARHQYWLAIAEYLAGDEASAAGRFTRLVDQPNHGELDAVAQNLAKLGRAALAEQASQIPAVELSEGNNLAPLETKLVRAWSGRIALRQGRWKESAGALRQAVAGGDTNPATALHACVACLLSDSYSDAQYLVDFVSSPTRTLDDVAGRTERLLHDVETTTVLSTELPRQVELASKRRRIETWIWTQRARLDGVASKAHELPATSEPLLLLLQGEYLEQTARLAEAYRAYSNAAAAAPNLQAELHAEHVAGDEGLLAARTETFAASIPGGSYIAASATTSTATLDPYGAAVFRTAGNLVADFTTTGSSPARITVIARADLAENRGAVIQPVVDTFSPLPLYVGREGWDCYSFTVPLSAGDHRLRLTYGQQADAVTAEGENRSLYILGILVDTKAAAD
jgi:hypothetical protein